MPSAPLRAWGRCARPSLTASTEAVSASAVGPEPQEVRRGGITPLLKAVMRLAVLSLQQYLRPSFVHLGGCYDPFARSFAGAASAFCSPIKTASTPSTSINLT